MKFSLNILGKDIVNFRSGEDLNPATMQLTGKNISTWLFGRKRTKAGVSVNEERALRLSAVYGCTRVLAETTSTLPFSVMQRSNGRRDARPDHPADFLFRGEPNEQMTTVAWIDAMITMAVLWGDGISLIHRNNNYQPESVEFFHRSQVSIVKTQDGEVYYFLEGYPDPFTQWDVIHLYRHTLNGYSGLSVIKYAAESMGLSVATEEFGSSFFGNGANASGVLMYDKELSDQAYKRLKDDWKHKYQGNDNNHETIILEAGMKYEKITIPPEDAQFLETRKFQGEEICRWFGVKPHMISMLDKATFNNIEHLGLEFVQYTLLPWIVRLEQEMRKKLCTEKEKREGYYIKGNLNGLLRGDITTRKEFYKEMIDRGIFFRDEVRELEDMNPLPNGHGRVITYPMNNDYQNVDEKYKKLDTNGKGKTE